MKQISRLSVFFVVIVFVSALGCAGNATREGTREYVSDSWITTKIKAGLVGDPQVKATEVNVESFMGVVQLAVGCILFVRATPYLTAAEISLIGLLESILAPLWTWLGVGERPSNIALLGGGIVIGSLLVNELLSLRRKSA